MVRHIFFQPMHRLSKSFGCHCSSQIIVKIVYGIHRKGLSIVTICQLSPAMTLFIFRKIALQKLGHNGAANILDSRNHIANSRLAKPFALGRLKNCVDQIGQSRTECTDLTFTKDLDFTCRQECTGQLPNPLFDGKMFMTFPERSLFKPLQRGADAFHEVTDQTVSQRHRMDNDFLPRCQLGSFLGCNTSDECNSIHQRIESVV